MWLLLSSSAPSSIVERRSTQQVIVVYDTVLQYTVQPRRTVRLGYGCCITTVHTVLSSCTVRHCTSTCAMQSQSTRGSLFCSCFVNSSFIITAYSAVQYSKVPDTVVLSCTYCAAYGIVLTSTAVPSVRPTASIIAGVLARNQSRAPSNTPPLMWWCRRMVR